MISNCSPRNPQPFNPLFQRETIRFASQLKKLALKRTYPTSLEFKIQDIDKVNNASLKKATKFLSKRTRKLTNPPIKHTLQRQPILTRHLTSLQIKPEDAAKYISQITYRFSRLNHFAILDDKDSFTPMRLRHKVNPMRYLKTFIYDHEFCRDFMKCARYTTNLKMRKTSLDLNHLKRLQRLQNIHILLKTKYLSLPEEDTKYTKELGSILMAAPLLKNVILDQEVDPENHPYMFIELAKILQKKDVNVDLIADFVDVSKTKDLSMEKIIQNINEHGIRNLHVNYVGIMRDSKRFGRSFYAPIHVKKELYVRFLKTILAAPFKQLTFSPIVDSSYIDSDLQEAFVELLRETSEKKVTLPKLSLTYNLDMVEVESLDSILDLYDEKIGSYEIAIVGSSLRKGLSEKLESHFTSAFSKLQKEKTEITLKFSAKNLGILKTLIQLVPSRTYSALLSVLNIQVSEPIDNSDLKTIYELLRSSKLSIATQGLEIKFSQRKAPKCQDLFELLSNITDISPNCKRLMLSYHNSAYCDAVLEETFEMLRKNYYGIDFYYEISDDMFMFE